MGAKFTPRGQLMLLKCILLDLSDPEDVDLPHGEAGNAELVDEDALVGVDFAETDESYPL
jgi:hypothetical protein